LRFDSAQLIPTDNTGTNSDASFDLGNSGVRFKDLYLSGDVKIGTSGRTTYGSGGFYDNAAQGNNIGLMTGGNHVFLSDGNGTATDNSRDIGSSTRRIRDVFVGGGVYLGGTGSANKLDDYEEGTWTPVVRGSTTAGSYTYSLGYAMYTKIGRQVTITFYLANITEVTAGTGYLQIHGCPFTKATNQYVRGPVSLQSINWFSSNTYGGLEFITSSATSVLYVRLNGDNYQGSDLQTNELVSGSSDIGGTITYFVS